MILPSTFVVYTDSSGNIYTEQEYETKITDVLGNLISIPVDQIKDGVKIATGSYTGTGTYGSSNPNSLTFSFPPEFLVVSPNQEPYRLFLVRGMTKSNTRPTGGSDGNVAVAWYGSTVSWYGDSTGGDYLQLNRRGTPYFYFAIG